MFPRRRGRRAVSSSNMSTKVTNTSYYTPPAVTGTPTEYSLGFGSMTTTEITNLKNWEYIKLNAIRYEFRPNTITPINFPGNTDAVKFKPEMITLFEPNVDISYPSAPSMIKNVRHKKHAAFRKFSRYVRLNHTEEINLGGTTNVSVQKKGGIWISTKDVDATSPDFGRLIVCPTNDGADYYNIDYHVYTTLYFSCKKYNLSGYS